jgi:hypothetical protein
VARPDFQRQVARLAARSPHAPRRHLHQRRQHPRRVAHRLGVRADAALDQRAAKLAPGERPALPEQLPRRRGGSRRVGARLCEPAAQHPLDRGLHERAQEGGVARSDEMHRAAHERDPHELAVGEHAAELVRVEVPQPRPQPHVGRHGGLRLKPGEMLHRRGDRHGRALEQQLAREQRAVERTAGEDRAHSPARRVTVRPTRRETTIAT